MKKLLAALFIVVIMFCAVDVTAQTKTLDIVWSQVLPSPNDMASWNIYSATVAGGPYTLFVNVPYLASQTQYTTSQIFTSPSGQRVTYYFVMDAVDIGGNLSPKSNQIPVTIDFVAPDAPVIISITVR